MLNSNLNVLSGAVSTGLREVFNLQTRGSNTNAVIKITPNHAFHTGSCTIKSHKSLGGSLSPELLILLSCQRTLLPELFKAGAIKKYIYIFLQSLLITFLKITVII